MTISIIILNYNSTGLLKNSLDSILKIHPKRDLEIIVIDNNSLDRELFDTLQKERPEIIFIKNDRNFGFAVANNQGAKISKGDVLLFLNPDTIIIDDVFERVIEYFEGYKEIGIISPQLVLTNGRLQPYSFGREKAIDKITNKSLNEQLIRQGSYLFTDWVSGTALAIRRELFERIKGFDEKIFMYFEDRDLCRRVKDLNYKVMVLAERKIVHLGGQSSKDNKKRKELYYRSQNYYWRKYYGPFIAFLFRLIRWPYKILTS
jgi:GT2 family glycosyltransferase